MTGTLVVGANGQVGFELAARLLSTPDTVVTTRSGEFPLGRLPCVALDVGDIDAVRDLIARLRPRQVLNAAAHTAVDRAESERDLAYRLNAEAPGAMAEACRRIGARFVHYSTDYVFDGTARTPYREDSPTAPLGVYGGSKCAGEQAVIAATPDHLILRTAWVYGARGHNFLRTMLRLGAERDQLRLVDDQIGCPTPAAFIAQATLALIERNAPSGIVNVVTQGRTSWFGFAQAIFEQAVARGLLDRAPGLVPITSDEYPTPARRPAFSVLDTSRLAAFGVPVPDWRDGLARVFDAIVDAREPRLG